MLKQRVITAVVMMIVVGAALLFLSPGQFSGFVALVLLAGAWEWTRLLKMQPVAQISSLVLFTALLGLMMSGYGPSMTILIGGSICWWSLALVLVVSYPRGAALWQSTPVLLLAGILVLLPGMGALAAIRNLPGYIAYLLVFIALVAAADIGAYCAGRTFGKLKLAPLVSPNKTWEGFVGGLTSTVLVGTAALGQLPRLHDIDPWRLMVAILGCVALAVFSVVGDLFESMLKRYCEAKDSSWLLPGHGGVLDRLDSITAALPVYVLILHILEIL